MKKHLPIIVGIALPIVFIIIISLVIYVPTFFIKPEHNFIYTTTNNGIYGQNSIKQTYTVKNGSLVQERVQLPSDRFSYSSDEILYMYDVKSDTSHQVSFDDVKDLAFDPGPSSPDGYLVRYEYNSEGIFDLFGGNRGNSGYFIEKGNSRKKLNVLSNSGYAYEGNIKFIGWVK